MTRKVAAEANEGLKMALKLAEEGWAIEEKVLLESATLFSSTKQLFPSAFIRQLALQSDLKKFGLPQLKARIDRKFGRFCGPAVLQLEAVWMDKSGHLMLTLTDGYHSCPAIIHGNIDRLNSDTPYGVKVQLYGTISFKGDGLLPLTALNAKILGGSVTTVKKEKWNHRRTKSETLPLKFVNQPPSLSFRSRRLSSSCHYGSDSASTMTTDSNTTISAKRHESECSQNSLSMDRTDKIFAAKDASFQRSPKSSGSNRRDRTGRPSPLTLADYISPKILKEPTHTVAVNELNNRNSEQKNLEYSGKLDGKRQPCSSSDSSSKESSVVCDSPPQQQKPFNKMGNGHISARIYTQNNYNNNNTYNNYNNAYNTDNGGKGQKGGPWPQQHQSRWVIGQAAPRSKRRTLGGYNSRPNMMCIGPGPYAAPTFANQYDQWQPKVGDAVQVFWRGEYQCPEPAEISEVTHERWCKVRWLSTPANCAPHSYIERCFLRPQSF